MYKGSCLCGSVQYEINGDIGDGYYCHCQRCRKASGTAFASNALIRFTDFKLIQGHAHFKTYHNEETGVERYFCSHCGSPILSKRLTTEGTAIRLGSLDTDLLKGPKAHIFVASKATWHEIRDELPCFQERPQG